MHAQALLGAQTCFAVLVALRGRFARVATVAQAGEALEALVSTGSLKVHIPAQDTFMKEPTSR